MNYRSLLLSVVLATTLAAAQDAAERIAWNRAAAPFRIVGNVFYVGTEGLSAS